MLYEFRLCFVHAIIWYERNFKLLGGNLVILGSRFRIIFIKIFTANIAFLLLFVNYGVEAFVCVGFLHRQGQLLLYHRTTALHVNPVLEFLSKVLDHQRFSLVVFELGISPDLEPNA